MNKLVQLAYPLFNGELTKIQRAGPVSYAIRKMGDLNPLKSTAGYQKKVRGLEKRARTLKAIRKHFSVLSKKDETAAARVDRITERIDEIHSQLRYLKGNENANSLLKWSLPFNLIAPGSGSLVRTAAYGIKILNAASQPVIKSTHVKDVAGEISIAGALAVASNFFYEKIQSLISY